MAFVVESGSGDSTANAYISDTFADTHHGDRGNTLWADFTTNEKQSGIVRATDYIDKRFGKQFRGIRKSKGQGLEWPRLSAFDNDGYQLSGVDDLPRQLEKAAAEYALRALIYMVLSPDPLLPVPAQSMASGAAARSTGAVGGEITFKREKVDVLEEETRYRRPGQSVNFSIIPAYPEADFWLAELIESSLSTRLVRA